ncbi:NACHT, LRR and PYD domains-containing protein 3-like [Scyliorhinus torazame]|uniref:NACHT, LRR and PYD domains-containing protein 3-like n=1 Tax=Scyliorhinus torazame TaxID=75743 RepID=UPI003B5BFAC7
MKQFGFSENDHCAGDLASTLSTNRSLTDLKLGFNRLGDSGVKILCVALRNPDCKLQTLWLYRNDITVYSAKDLFATLNTNQSLEILNLNQNDLGGLGVKLLSEFLRKPECKIRKLGLSAVGLTDSYVEDLASALSTNQLLTDLNLGYNKVGDAGVKLLSVALKNQNCTIQELGLNNNSLTDSCTEDLSSALSRNRSVRVLDLKSNSFTDRSVPALRYLILTCRSLKSIRLCENKFRSKGKRHLELMWGSRPGMSVTL